MDFDDQNNVCGSGLNGDDWHLMRDAILYSIHNHPDSPSASIGYDALPPRLKEHEIGRIICARLAGDETANLNDAANLMVGGMDNAWIALEKS